MLSVWLLVYSIALVTNYVWIKELNLKPFIAQLRIANSVLCEQIRNNLTNAFIALILLQMLHCKHVLKTKTSLFIWDGISNNSTNWFPCKIINILLLLIARDRSMLNHDSLEVDDFKWDIIYFRREFNGLFIR